MKIIHFSFLTAILIVSFFAISSSCKKKKKFCESGTTCRSVLEAKDFFLFKEGTWWVYEEETTHERDSQYVYQYTNTSGYDFDMRVHSTLDDYDYHYWPFYASGAIETCSESEAISGKCLYLYRSKGKVGDFIGESVYFFVNYKVGDFAAAYNVNYSNDLISISDEISQIQFGSITWNNLVKVHELSELQENNQPTNHYYKKNIGLVRKELMDSNQVWNLVNYHIEQ